jgi:hypothetical protein
LVGLVSVCENIIHILNNEVDVLAAVLRHPLLNGNKILPLEKISKSKTAPVSPKPT